MTHEDERRTLTSVPYKDGEIKIIVAKQDCILGNHYHKIKTEIFRLIEGSGRIKINRKSHTAEHIMTKEHRYIVDPNEPHVIELKKDTILMCICSHPYDKNDDYEK
jgi:mannose-6-phosphate isomerase-like protein (cupin superfamily)